MSRYRKGGDPNTKSSNSWHDFKVVKAYLPPTLAAKLKHQSRLRGLPMSRLLSIAIDNEMDQESPFRYDTNLPDTEYEEYTYVTEAGVLLDYICKFPRGVGRDELCLARSEMGFDNRYTVLAALKELLDKEMVEEIIPSGKKFIFWQDDYRLVRAKDIVFDDKKGRKKTKRFKKVDGESTKYERRITDDEVER